MKVLAKTGVAILAVTLCALPSAVAGTTGRSPLGPSSADFGVWGSVPGADARDGPTILVYPSVIKGSDGSMFSTYDFPDGSTMVRVIPPPGFDPSKADEETLLRFGFPPPPSDPDDHSAWLEAMLAFRSTPPTPDEVEFAFGSGDPDFAVDTQHNWAGYIAGTTGVQSHTYVAVKGNFVVPTNSTSCGGSPPHAVGFWIGMGGTGGTYSPDNLVQQGIACGKSQLGSLTTYHPWYEFANTDPTANKFCGIGSNWTVNPGDTIYQNMSFQTSSNTAYFYLEDQTTGLAQPCNYHPPMGWHWDLNTSEWVGEASADEIPADFGSVHFTNARTELYSNSSWVTLGSQPHLKDYAGWQYADGHIYKCIDASALDTGGAGFTLTWIHPTCYDPSP